MLDDIIIDSRLTQSKNGKIRKDNNCNDNKLTSEQKWWVSLLLGLLFVFISSPFFYVFTNYVFNLFCGTCIYVDSIDNGYCVVYGGPTLLGLFIHFIIFTLVIRFLLW